MLTLSGLSDACSDACTEQYDLYDPQLQPCIDRCAAPAPAAPKADAWLTCWNGCIDTNSWAPYATCVDKCDAQPGSGGRYGSAATVTKVPGGTVINNPSNVPAGAALPLCANVPTGTTCFQPSPVTNWWVVGALGVLGALAAVGTVIAVRRHGHAA